MVEQDFWELYENLVQEAMGSLLGDVTLVLMVYLVDLLLPWEYTTRLIYKGVSRKV